jgi:hypothetical protein
MNWISKVLNTCGNPRSWSSKILFSEKTRKWPVVKHRSTNINDYLKEIGNTKKLRKDGFSAKEARWIFKVLSGADQGREYIANTKEIPIGRHPENLILLRDPKASRFHAVIHLKGSRLVLEDLDSTNGTRVNGEFVVNKRAVFSGDLIKIGETIIKVSMEKN